MVGNPVVARCGCGMALLVPESRAAGRCTRCRHLDLRDGKGEESFRRQSGEGQGADRVERDDAEEGQEGLSEEEVAWIAVRIEGHRAVHPMAVSQLLHHLVGTVLGLAAEYRELHDVPRFGV